MVCRVQLAVPSKKKSATECRSLASVVALVKGWPGALPDGYFRPLPPFPDAGLWSGEGSPGDVVGTGRAGTEMAGIVD